MARRLHIGLLRNSCEYMPHHARHLLLLNRFFYMKLLDVAVIPSLNGKVSRHVRD